MPELQSQTTSIPKPQQDAWSLPDLPLHKPNCDAVTNTELLQAAISKWHASKNGIVEIPYTFQGAPYLTQPYGGAASIHVQNAVHNVQSIKDAQLLDNVKTNVRLGLQSWERASGGKVHFVEAKKLGPRSHGLSFYLADEKKLLADNTVAFTQLALDKKGYVDQAAIVFPNSKKFWDLNANTPDRASYIIRVINHEMGHAIVASEHLHDYKDIVDKIWVMKDGVFCSVMPYDFLINSPYNQCNQEEGHCNPPFAATPGPLDERLVKLNYENDVPPERPYDYFTVQNVSNAFFDNAITTGAYTGVNSFVTHLSFTPNKQAFSERTANLITDGAYASGMVLLNCPLSEVAYFVATAGLKYLPTSTTGQVTDKIPEPVKAIWNSPITSVVLSAAPIAWEIYQGNPVLPIIAINIAGSMGNSLGAYFGDKIGRFNAYVTNKVGQFVLSYWPSAEEDESEEELNEFSESLEQKSNEVLKNSNNNSNEQQATGTDVTLDNVAVADVNSETILPETTNNNMENNAEVTASEQITAENNSEKSSVTVVNDDSLAKRLSSYLSPPKSQFSAACNFFKTKATDLIAGPFAHEDSLEDDNDNVEDKDNSYRSYNALN